MDDTPRDANRSKKISGFDAVSVQSKADSRYCTRQRLGKLPSPRFSTTRDGPTSGLNIMGHTTTWVSSQPVWTVNMEIEDTGRGGGGGLSHGTNFVAEVREREDMSRRRQGSRRSFHPRGRGWKLKHTEPDFASEKRPEKAIDKRCDNMRLWLSARNCQVPIPTSQNLELEQRIQIFGAV